jgi:hypothetical protein
MILDKLKEFPKMRTLLIATLIILIPFLVLTLIFCFNELRLLQTMGYGVLNFELAWTPATIDTIFTAWGTVEMQQQTFLTYLDYLYILFYVLFGAECILLVSRKAEGKLQRIGLAMTVTFLMAGISDAIENLNLLIMLHNPASYWIYDPFFASFCASFKIGFLGAGLGFLYIISMIIIAQKLSFSKSYLYITLIGGGIILIGLLAFWNLFVCLLIGAIYFSMLFLIIWRVKIEPMISPERPRN